MRLRERSALVVVILAGLLTFGAVYALLHAFLLDSAVASRSSSGEVNETRAVPAADSVAAALPPGLTLVGVPQTGSEPLLRDVQPGDRLDVLVSLPGAQETGPLTAVAVRGARVVRSGSPSDPLLVQVPDSDAIVLAHLLLGGRRLSYIVWSANGNAPSLASAPVAPVDARTVRQVLGLEPTSGPTPGPTTAAPGVAATIAPVASATPAPVAATPTPSTVPSARGATSGFIYQVQPGDTWVSVADAFGLEPQELRRWNDAPDDAVLVPGSLLIVPRRAQ